LREQCLSDSPGNHAFWTNVREEGMELALISDKEAKRHGGRSSITEKQAKDVRTVSAQLS
jgi:ATP-dependent DNA helicase 2 subunit 2